MIEAEEALYKSMEEAVDKLFTNMGRPRPGQEKRAATNAAKDPQPYYNAYRYAEQLGLTYARALGMLEGRVLTAIMTLFANGDAISVAAWLREAIEEAERMVKEGAEHV